MKLKDNVNTGLMVSKTHSEKDHGGNSLEFEDKTRIWKRW